ncbi:hypothetical protein [Halorubrum salsamenti]|uniref:hypothetical protein n=1 Tax=Halorubrum salsamenti TaxID=2583990 RepID=UPI0031F2F013
MRDLLVAVPQRRDLVHALGVAGEEHGVRDVAVADLDVVLHLVVGVLAPVALVGHVSALRRAV